MVYSRFIYKRLWLKNISYHSCQLCLYMYTYFLLSKHLLMKMSYFLSYNVQNAINSSCRNQNAR